jgi:UDP-N-acetylmuramate dehydrogenase
MVPALDKETLRELERLGQVLMNEPMKKYTTFKTGGPADILVHPFSMDSVRDIANIARQTSIPLTIIGGGSNLLVGDKGIRGIVIRIGNGIPQRRIHIREDGTIFAESSISKQDFIEFSLNNEYEGIEFMAGIPGCIGGGIVMNAGTDLKTFSDILISIRYVKNNGTIVEKKITRDMATYRSLVIDDGAIILSAVFGLQKSVHLDSVRRRINKIVEERSHKHPINYPTAGSVFKNPEGLQAWKLIEDSGLRGKQIGGAAFSELHTNFIINFNNATSWDILNLIEIAIERVQTKYEVTLETEIRLLGEF